MANEKRLIDANALMDAFRRVIAERHDRERCISEENCNTCERECLWRRVVKKAPTVDAVEVVRCGQCKHWEQYYRLTGRKEPAGCGECQLISMDNSMNAYDFCSYGERRTENG